MLQSDIDEATTRHKEDLMLALTTIKKYISICSDELLQSILSSYDVQYSTLSSMSIQSLIDTLSTFRTLFPYEIASNKKHKDKLDQVEETLGTIPFLLEYMTEKRWGLPRHINQILAAYLLAKGFDVRMCASINTCSPNPYDHKSIVKKRKKAASVTATTPTTPITTPSSSSSKSKEVITIDDDSNSDGNYTDDDDASSSDNLISNVWLEVYLTDLAYTPNSTSSKRAKKPSSTSTITQGHISDENSPRWVHVDYLNSLIDTPLAIEAPVNDPTTKQQRNYKKLAYILAVDCYGGCVDVTPRYTTQYHYLSAKYRLKGEGQAWWQNTIDNTHRLHTYNNSSGCMTSGLPSVKCIELLLSASSLGFDSSKFAPISFICINALIIFACVYDCSDRQRRALHPLCRAASTGGAASTGPINRYSSRVTYKSSCF